MLTMRKLRAVTRTLTVPIIAALVVGAVVGFVVHAPGRPGTWDDIQKWGTFLVVVFGLPTALYQLRLQRLQLREQQAVIKADSDRSARRDELLDRQLLELEQRALMTERAQAELIEFSWRPSRPVDESQPGAGDIWMGVVKNASHRPVRDVVCRIQPHPAQGYDFSAEVVGELTGVPMGLTAQMPVFAHPQLGDRVALLRGGVAYGFKTKFPVADHQVARMIVRFTDDAGIHWEIDADLHLTKLGSRDW
jgi:hypothetical protein